jgi:hypothetical protein
MTEIEDEYLPRGFLDINGQVATNNQTQNQRNSTRNYYSNDLQGS